MFLARGSAGAAPGPELLPGPGGPRHSRWAGLKQTWCGPCNRTTCAASMAPAHYMNRCRRLWRASTRRRCRR